MRSRVSDHQPLARWFGSACIVLLVSLLAPSRADAESWSSAWHRRYQRVANGVQRRCSRQWIRSQLVSADDLRHYGLYIRCDLATADPDLPLVVFIHGFNSTPDRNQAILQPLCEAGFPTAMFAYPNDDKIERSAALLSHELKRLARCFPSRNVALVTHSMGGLVARASVENPRLDPGNVKRLVMIAPPTHGTRLASFATGTDLYEYTFLAGTAAPWTRIKDSIVDGLGEAVDDVLPNSPFLKQLNARHRNPRVDYTVLLGSRGCVTQQDLNAARQTVRKTTSWIPWINRCGQRCDHLLADLREVVAGKGDGVVAIDRGRLAGVADTKIFPFAHSSVTGPPDETVILRVHEVILDRLGGG